MDLDIDPETGFVSNAPVPHNVALYLLDRLVREYHFAKLLGGDSEFLANTMEQVRSSMDITLEDHEEPETVAYPPEDEQGEAFAPEWIVILIVVAIFAAVVFLGMS